MIAKHLTRQAFTSARCTSTLAAPRLAATQRSFVLHGASGRCLRLRASEGSEPPAKDSPPEPSAARPPRRPADEAPQRDIVIPILVAISLAGYAAVAVIAFLDQ